MALTLQESVARFSWEVLMAFPVCGLVHAVTSSFLCSLRIPLSLPHLTTVFTGAFGVTARPHLLCPWGGAHCGSLLSSWVLMPHPDRSGSVEVLRGPHSAYFQLRDRSGNVQFTLSHENCKLDH